MGARHSVGSTICATESDGVTNKSSIDLVFAVYWGIKKVLHPSWLASKLAKLMKNCMKKCWQERVRYKLLLRITPKLTDDLIGVTLAAEIDDRHEHRVRLKQRRETEWQQAEQCFAEFESSLKPGSFQTPDWTNTYFAHFTSQVLLTPNLYFQIHNDCNGKLNMLT